ncbi:hypothetical protein Leryth_019684, partial [Lithospermum erythrorhizon]
IRSDSAELENACIQSLSGGSLLSIISLSIYIYSTTLLLLNRLESFSNNNEKRRCYPAKDQVFQQG